MKDWLVKFKKNLKDFFFGYTPEGYNQQEEQKKIEKKKVVARKPKTVSPAKKAAPAKAAPKPKKAKKPKVVVEGDAKLIYNEDEMNKMQKDSK